jgi:hypothetical protein
MQRQNFYQKQNVIIMTRTLNAKRSYQQTWKIEWNMCFVKMIQNYKMIEQ